MTEFEKLHHQNDPLLIGNVWNVISAKRTEKAGFKAIGTSSAAIATMLGYKDGEDLQFSDLEYIVQLITAKTSIPLSVDIEAGYSREPREIVEHIKKLSDLGVVGINIEDSIVSDQRELVESENFEKTLFEINNQLEKGGVDMFINVRTDPFLIGHINPAKESIKRIGLYENAGVNGVFVPCMVAEEDILSVVESTSLPVNVMCMPDLPDFKKLKELGIKRISMGNFLFNKLYQQMDDQLNTIQNEGSFKTLFS